MVVGAAMGALGALGGGGGGGGGLSASGGTQKSSSESGDVTDKGTMVNSAGGGSALDKIGEQMRVLQNPPAMGGQNLDIRGPAKQRGGLSGQLGAAGSFTDRKGFVTPTTISIGVVGALIVGIILYTNM